MPPLTVAGGLLMLVAGTALVTYLLITMPPRLAAASGPPEAFRAAATQQAMQPSQGAPLAAPTASPAGPPPTPQPGAAAAPAGPTPTLLVAVPAVLKTPSATPAPLSEDTGGGAVDGDFWLSIPSLDLEAPILAYGPRKREVEGIPVNRMLVPNTFAVGWDETSAEPGFAGNTVLAGHNNLFGAVFGDLNEIQVGAEISVWSEYGVFTYTVRETLLLEEEGQPIEVRRQNAQWLNDTPDDRLTLITCWPRTSYTHRFIVVATP